MINQKVILFERKEECCGCGACAAICNNNAIMMESDDEGFMYPEIDRNKCVACKMCIKVCPIKQSNNNK